jgi:multicomponent Na+:H+ antiporter subunit G
MSLLNIATIVLTATGCFFFLAGTVGLLRFPDVLSRLHAVTKADNLGLGLIVAGLAIHSGSIFTSIKMILIWLFVLLAGATSCYLIAHGAYSGSEEVSGD